MKRLFTLLAGMCLCVSMAAAQSQTAAEKAKPSKNTATEQKLIEMEKQLWQAWQDGKGQPFREMLSSESVGVSPMGVDRGNEKMAAEIEKGVCKVVSWEIHNPSVQWIDNNTALLTYHSTQNATCEGEKVPEAVWSSSLWVRRGGKWQAAFHQETPDMTPQTKKQ